LPTFTFVASFEAVIGVGAIPVLVDIDDTLTLDPQAVERAITKKTKAVMPVHMCGSMAQLDELKSICTAHNLFLIEDACQAIGGTYKGQYLGTIGKVGTFSFDFVKIMTCGEGGVVMTNDAEIAEKCDQFSDHGHDHYGKDRGADLHPYLGYNYRISELHAAVGLAQIRKMDHFLQLQRRNHQIIYNCLKDIQGLSFRRIPDTIGDTGSFLSFFLPTAKQAEAAANALAQAGIAGNPYWYDNNWHYIRKWEHLKSAAFLNRIPEEQKQAIIHYAQQSFAPSDALISRCISSAINLSWTVEQATERGEKMAEILRQIIVNH